jgi:nucleotide-binding universal stress UspA family protein
LERAANSVPQNVEYEQNMETGAPAAVILEYAEILNADLIVMGSRGLGVVKGVLLGSVSQYIIERAKCPVMVVK